MAIQPTNFGHPARQPGAINLGAGQLALEDIISIIDYGPQSAQTTLEQLQLFFNGRPIVPIRVEPSGHTYDLADGFRFLLIDTSFGGNTIVNLPVDPVDGEMSFVGDGAGFLGSTAPTITVVGNIDGAANYVMQAPWQGVMFTYSAELARWVTPISGIGSGGTGVVGFGLVTNSAVGQVLTVAQSYQRFTNIGSAGPVTFQLPTPTAGLTYTFDVVAPFSVIVDVGGGVSISLGELVSSNGGQIASASVYSSVTLVAMSSILWAAVSLTGSWSLT